ncbi:hypothetical protein Forpe1208_v012195 [Fusarium oxysporum f. sp. rapae]|uniref:Uncharacterized protein n=1 Tax=Fusarium oxysporum f. sp. rapae TaxID=485398 RepID=A0A8J5NMY2_FUSOX|nr:hypothetical protein Forpe1208_v012195 [Fusarium oxysporum f. sp. rapae]
MSSQKEQLSPEERQKRLQEEHYAKQVAARDVRLAKLRQQARQAAQRSYGIPSTTGLLAYPPLPSQANPQQQGEMSPQLYLHEGLDDAFKNGKVDVSRFLLQSGAPMTRATPAAVLRAPADKQVALFQVLIEHGWTVNTPESLLPEIFRSNNEPLFDWFLEQGADPNVAGPQNDLGQTLRLAASQGTVQVVQKLLNAGAKMASSGLYWAAGAYPEGSVPNIRRVEPSADFDKSRIPVMELLLENGGDVNHRLETRHMEC